MINLLITDRILRAFGVKTGRRFFEGFGCKHLQKFVSSVMRMAHVYQPVMIQTLIAHEGRATVREIANKQGDALCP